MSFSRMMDCPLIVGLILATVAIESILCMPSLPTIELVKNFDAKKDAETLREAMQGEGTDEPTIINVLAHRTLEERLAIAKQYEEDFSEYLLTDLKSETSGDFRAAIVALMSPLGRYYARELNHAIEGDQLDNNTIIDILVPLGNKEIAEIAASYEDLYEKQLVNDIMDKTTDETRILFKSLCLPNRDNDGEVDKDAARKDAKTLHNAAVGKVKMNETVFNDIFTTRSFSQVKLILDHYEKIAEDSPENAIKAKFSEPVRKGYLSIVSWVRNKAAYFAKQLHSAVGGKKVDKATLIRIIIARSEIDLGDIKRIYQKMYGNTLAGDINSNVKSGSFRKLLVAFLGSRVG